MMTACVIRDTESGRSCWITVATISCIRSAPIRVPTTLIRPPDNGVPPTTTAVMALSSIRRPTNEGSLAPRRAVFTTPASAASTPHAMYTVRRVRPTGRPASLAALRLPPIATSLRPKVDHRTATRTQADSPATISKVIGMPCTVPLPSVDSVGSKISTSLPSARTRATARPATRTPSVAMIGWMPKNATSVPLRAPTTAPAATPMATATHVP
jgi:hypothetical protein